MNLLSELNDKQCEAVCCTEGPLLILAGAGSGKTRVITYRIAYLMSEMKVAPWNICAITFTNKAANEMKERVQAVAGMGSEAVWVSTFHSSCSRILRRFADRIGYGTNFTIYDTDDSKAAVKDIVKEMDLDPKKYAPANAARFISNAKNHMISPKDCASDAKSREDANMAEIYRRYNERLFKNNAFDFDDLLIKTVELLRKDKEVREYYQNRFQYICVDEYQDTNRIQFEFVCILAAKYGNICVVGDDDQSIYKFRGADIRNILDFEKHFKDTTVVRLEQNYRSTGNILTAANEVIRNNTERKSKKLWTENEAGAPIEMVTYDSAYGEASGVVNSMIKVSREKGISYKDFAILYRTNAQSRLFEEQLIYNNIPYRIVGSVNFYSRKEIKDIMAYLKTIDNARDDVAVKRIINIPRRGIGATSIDRVSEYAAEMDISFYEACERAQEIPGLSRAAAKIERFVTFIRMLRTEAQDAATADIIEKVLAGTGYRKELEEENTDEAAERIGNIDELIGKAKVFDETNEEKAGLSGFLQEVALVADIDSLDEDSNGVVLMTLHSAKGLEFDQVYIAGLEEGVFPGFKTIYDESGTEIEEERRLFYVGITRARKHLTLSMAKTRMVRGEIEAHRPSVFVDELPDGVVEFHTEGSSYGSGYRSSYSDGRRSGLSFSEGGRGSSGMSYSEGGRGRAGLSFSGDAGGHSGRTYSDRERDYADTPVSAGRNQRGGNGRGSFRRTASPGPDFRYKTFNPDDFKVSKAKGLSYGKGDRVRHVKFGEGTVLDIKENPKDYEVTVEFDKAGVKRLFAAFAKLEKI